MIPQKLLHTKKTLRKCIIVVCCVLLSLRGLPQAKHLNPTIIPLPNFVQSGEGTFTLSENTQLVVNGKNISNDLNYFNAYLKSEYGFSLKQVSDLSLSNYIRFDESAESIKDDEGYDLEITTKGITIKAKRNGAGFFYAIQSLIQLLPAPNSASKEIVINGIKLKDQPRFKWRGMHLDVCRHFFPKEFIKKYIDLMALYKLNTFHWHLTEDQGWRIEIKKYPNLTQLGAWRKGSMIGKYDRRQFDTIRYGGFYTQEDVREIVSYAEQRHITIVPEIEMPGHSVAAIAAYPFLSCSGKQIEVEKSWGVFDDVYCTKDSVFEFLQNVLDEVIALFPGKIIHIGGDECPKVHWKACKNCQQRMKEEKLKDEHELQSYFITRIETYLNSKGRQIIGWDEILEGGLAPNAAVMSWRGTEGGMHAARLKHTVVMSPGKPCYFDHYQSNERATEPLAIGGYNPIDSVYAYDPVPAELKKEEQGFIIGAQANVWTEYIVNERQVEYMALPRMCALSEVLWTTKENKVYSDFKRRLKSNVRILDNKQVNYAKHFLME